MRLVLFDVDGTLLSAHGAGRRALGQALIDVYGTAGPIDSYDFHGATDPQIVWDLLTAAQLAPTDIGAGEAACYRRYAERLAVELAGGRVSLFPGAGELVRRIAGQAGVLTGLLTGNIEVGARLKLEPSGLLPLFRVGAYGSDDRDRTRLPAIAAARAAALLGRGVTGREMVIIGDTPRDVACAQAFGAACLAVATGRHRMDELREAGADHVFPDLADTAAVLAAIEATR